MADQLVTVSLSELHESEDNLRQDFGNIPELAKAIDEMGLIEPIVTRKRDEGGYWIVAGARRARALRHLGRKKSEVLVREYSRQQAFDVTVAENAHRESFNAVELASSFAKMQQDFGYSMDQISQRLKLSRTMVADMLQIHKNLLEPTKKALISGRIGTQSGVQLSKVIGERLQNAALADVLRLVKKEGEQPPLRAVKKLIQDKYLTTAKRGLSKRQREERRQGGTEGALRRLVVNRLLVRVVELVERKHHLDETDLRMMALAHAEAGSSTESAREVFERRHLKPGSLSKVGATQLRSLVVELALWPFVQLEAGEYSAGAKAVARAYALSLSELEKNVAAEQAAEALFTS